MKTHVPFFILSVLCVLFLAETGLCGNPKIGLLEQKKNDISALLETLNQKRMLAEGIRTQLRSHIEELTNEIASEQERRSIKTYKQASEHPRIEFDLKLLQRLFLYTDSLDAKIAYLKIAENELAYWRMLADDDLKIFRTMSDMDIVNLLAGVGGVLKTHRSKSGEKLIDLHDTKVRTPEEIWDTVTKSKQGK